MVRMKVTPRVDQGRGSPTGGDLWQYTSLARRVRKEKKAVGGVGGFREVTRTLPNPGASQNGSGGKALKD